ncbi:DNA polymerase III subunit delta [Vibrio agarivorans]|uniref:DNA polymerase III subunit delta n=1 Tax=Vibrio agarivorans TaxID=153622 RepID=A0ABT7Y162_9VIBR|nr:DNA polymerase III subunit delta [Vibrio agarivorans]MDN2481779.1 DNA polymerase III subunit delta [Vibrio agarivorans]
MRIFADRLLEQLSKNLSSVYLIFGNEPLLLHESRLAIAEQGKKQGFEERHRFSIDNQTDWNAIFDCFQAMSLFSSQQIVELEVGENGVNAAQGKELLELSAHLNPDTILVVVGGKLTKAQENSKWFKALSSLGTWVNCLTPDISRLPQFVRQRCQKLGLKPDEESLQMLAQWHEGNLLALTQSLEKLALQYPDGQLSLVRIEQSLSRHNHFTVFHWIDALLAGKANRAQRILRQLEAEGVEGVIIARSLQKELKLLIQLHGEMQQASMAQVFEKHRIWQSKRPLYSAALQRLDNQALHYCWSLLADAEVMLKTQYEQPVWPMIQQLGLTLCSPQATFPVAARRTQ